MENKTQRENFNQKIIFGKTAIYDTRDLFNVYYSDGSYCASIAWVGNFEDSTVLQPAIFTNNSKTKFISFDGQNNYNGGSEQIIMPDNGTLYAIDTGTLYYFNNDNPLKYNPKYSLSRNNCSIRMNNISIFNADYSSGVMMDFRASVEGIFDDEYFNGNIVVLSAIDTIN